MPRRSKVSGEQRAEAVLRLLRRETTTTGLARELGVSEATLYQWRDKFLQAGSRSLNHGAPDDELKRLRHEVSERDRIIGEQTVALNVLKKTLGLSG